MPNSRELQTQTASIGQRIAKLATLAALATLAGCHGHFAEDHHVAPGTFVWGLRFDLKTLDPALVDDTITNGVIQQVFETLVSVDGEGRVQPELAEKWTISPDGKTYKFHLRQGVLFSNKQLLTAEDVKFSFQRVLNPALSSTLAQSFLSSIQTIQVEGSDALTIKLSRPTPPFLKRLACGGLSIVCHVGVPANRSIQSPSEMIGTGPFAPISMESMTLLIANGRADYWGGPVAIKTLRIETVPDATVALNRFRSGELDLMQITPPDVEAVRSDPKLAGFLKLTPQAGVVYLQLNSHSLPSLADRRVRQALAMSIDRHRLERDVLHDSQGHATRFTPVGNGAPEILPYDPDKAAQLLTAAGYPQGKGLTKIQIQYAANGRQNPGAEAMVTDWRSNLGIDATIWAGASGALLEKNQHGDVPIYFTGWNADYVDAEDFLPQVARSGAPENHSGMSIPELDKLLDQISATTDSPARAKLVDQAEKLTLEDAHIIPLYFVNDPELLGPRFTGINFIPYGRLDLSKARPNP